MGNTFARRGSFHTFRLIRLDQSEYAISKRGPHYMGDRLFRDTGTSLFTGTEIKIDKQGGEGSGVMLDGWKVYSVNTQVRSSCETASVCENLEQSLPYKGSGPSSDVCMLCYSA